MIKRVVLRHILERLSQYPAVTLLGPRQAGKTTLAKSLPGAYFDLEKEQDRLRLDIEWEDRIRAKRLIVLDEAQAMPEIFPRLRSAIDEDRRRTGRFLLLGSVSPSLMTHIGEALTGRMALCELSPLMLQELPVSQQENLWRMGGYPDGGILRADRFPEWQAYYLELMAQRDLPNWGLPARPKVTERLFRMLAALHGQLWNASQLGRSLGLNYHTVNRYADFLDQAFLIRRLPAFATNIRKRLVRSPKIYWRDSGLLHALLGMGPEDDLYTKPWVGASWEGWVVEQILVHLAAHGRRFHAYHLRTSDQSEIDMLLEYEGRLWAFEIKLTSVPELDDLRRLRAVANLVDADQAVLVSRTSRPVRGRNDASLNVSDALELLLASTPPGSGLNI